MAARRKRNLLDAILTDTASAICVLDAERRLRHFSPGMTEKTGWEADKVEGLVCDPSILDSPTPIELLTSALAPSQEVLGGRTQAVESVLPQSTGGLWKTRLVFLPITNIDGATARIMVICTDDPRGKMPEASLSQKLHAEITSLRLEFRRRFSDHSFIGASSEIRKALDQAALLKNSSVGYSLVGPSGSGRRHLGKLIHVAGGQQELSFVELDCNLLTGEQLLVTLRELRRLSVDSSAPGHQRTGTLLLHNADRCPREVQQWLLDFLAEEGTAARFVATSASPLSAACEEGWMMSEFLQLFATLQLQLPPLHERGNDISLLAQHFTEHCRRTLETSAETLSADVLTELQFYRWPGNVRELRQVIVDACQNSFDVELTMEDLPFAFRAGLESQQLPTLPDESELSLEQILKKFETDVLLKTLESCRGNKAEAARRLGMTRPKLYRRLKSLGIDPDE